MVNGPKIPRITISVNAAQKRAIDQRARAAALSTSAYVKNKALEDMVEQVFAFIARELSHAGDDAKSSVDEGVAASAAHQVSGEERHRQIAAEVRASLAPEEIQALRRLFEA